MSSQETTAPIGEQLDEVLLRDIEAEAESFDPEQFQQRSAGVDRFSDQLTKKVQSNTELNKINKQSARIFRKIYFAMSWVSVKLSFRLTFWRIWWALLLVFRFLRPVLPFLVLAGLAYFFRDEIWDTAKLVWNGLLSLFSSPQPTSPGAPAVSSVGALTPVPSAPESSGAGVVNGGTSP